MADKKDLYEILGVSKSATQDEIKSAYRKLAIKYHPDRQYDKTEEEKKEAEEKFKEVNAAYSVLSDEEKKSNYDRFGSEDGGSSFGGFDPFSFFSSHFGGGAGFENIFGRMNGRHQPQYTEKPDINAPEDGDDIVISLTVPFRVVLDGVEHKFDVIGSVECDECHGTGCAKDSKLEHCHRCDGSGQIVHTEKRGFMISQSISMCPDCNGTGWTSTPCPKCHGHKRINTTKNITLKIPSGIENHQTLRLAGNGHCGVKGGKNGDMYVRLKIMDNDVYEREGLDLATKVFIDPLTATLGGKIKVITPYEEKEIEIPEETSNGKVLKLEKCGIKKNDSAGDLYLEVNIQPLQNLTDEQKEILRKIHENIDCDKNIPGYSEHNNKIKNIRN